MVQYGSLLDVRQGIVVPTGALLSVRRAATVSIAVVRVQIMPVEDPASRRLLRALRSHRQASRANRQVPRSAFLVEDGIGPPSHPSDKALWEFAASSAGRPRR